MIIKILRSIERPCICCMEAIQEWIRGYTYIIIQGLYMSYTRIVITRMHAILWLCSAIESAAGVHQGNPLWPLLFGLASRCSHCSSELQNPNRVSWWRHNRWLTWYCDRWCRWNPPRIVRELNSAKLEVIRFPGVAAGKTIDEFARVGLDDAELGEEAACMQKNPAGHCFSFRRNDGSTTETRRRFDCSLGPYRNIAWDVTEADTFAASYLSLTSHSRQELLKNEQPCSKLPSMRSWWGTTLFAPMRAWHQGTVEILQELRESHFGSNRYGNGNYRLVLTLQKVNAACMLAAFTFCSVACIHGMHACHECMPWMHAMHAAMPAAMNAGFIPNPCGSRFWLIYI